MDPQTAQSILQPILDDCQTPQRPLDQTRHEVELSDIDQTERSPNEWKTRHKMVYATKTTTS